MNSDTAAVRVTIVSTEPEVLRDLGWTLSTFGYQVVASTDWSEEASWRQDGRSGILLLDVRDQADVAHCLTRRGESSYSYRVVIHDQTDGDSLSPGLSALVDDVIPHPYSYGEVLARLRAGVRRLELERRLERAAVRDPSTGLLNRAGLISRLDRLDPSEAGDASLVLFGIDSFESIQSEYGRHASQSLLMGLARCVENNLSGGERVGVLRSDAIAVWLPGANMEAAKKLADSVVEHFGARETLSREIRSLPTLTAVVSQAGDGEPADLIERTEATLQHAACYGGGRVVLAEQVESQVLAWREQMESGEFFQGVVAQDVMEVFPLVLREDDASRGLDSLSQCRALPGCGIVAPCIPLVDPEGHLAGGIHVDLAAGEQGEGVTHDLPTIQADATLGDVLEALTETADGQLIVVHDNRPLGYIRGDALTSLFTEPLSAATYRGGAESCEGALAFVVPLTAEAAAVEV